MDRNSKTAKLIRVDQRTVKGVAHPEGLFENEDICESRRFACLSEGNGDDRYSLYGFICLIIR